MADLFPESGLTRWQKYHVTGGVDPPEGTPWARGAGEPWYARAAAAHGSLIVHAPVAPKRIMRNSDALPPPVEILLYSLIFTYTRQLRLSVV